MLPFELLNIMFSKFICSLTCKFVLFFYKQFFYCNHIHAQIEDIVEIFHKTKAYENCIFDESRSSLSIFMNLNLLTKDC